MNKSLIIILLCFAFSCSTMPEDTKNPDRDTREIKTGSVSVKIYSQLINKSFFSKALIEISGPDFIPITNFLTIDYTSNLIYGAVENIPAGKQRVCRIEVFDGENNLKGYGITSNITILPSQTTPVTVWIFLTEAGYANVSFNITIKNYPLNEDILVKTIFLDFTNETHPLSSNFSIDFTNCPPVENAYLKLIIFDRNYEIYNGVVLSNLLIMSTSNYTFNATVEISGGNCEVEGIITNGSITSLYIIDNFECGLFWKATNGFLILLDSEKKKSGRYSLKFSGLCSSNTGLFVSPEFFNTNYGKYISFWINGSGITKSIVLRAATNSCYWNLGIDKITNGEAIYPSKSASYGAGFDTKGNWYEVKLYVATNIVPEEFYLEFKGGSGGEYTFWVDDVNMY